MPSAADARPEPDPSAPVRFGIVVPVYGVVDLLDECLVSIEEQSFRDFEVVIVDDASTDGSVEVARRHAARDPRVTLVELAENVGLGGARNAGLARVTAPYLLFVDSDDTLPPGALQAVADRIDATGRPDVVLFGHALRHPDGRVEPYPRRSLLQLDGDAHRAELLAVLPTAWNKAYRRAFVEAHGFRFPPGTYEDVPWTYSVLLAAERVVTLDRVCYLYRQRAGGSILSSAGLTHLDLLDQYARVFAFLDAHPELETYRRAMFDRLTRHVPTVLAMTTRIAPAQRRVFFDAVAAAVRRHHPPGYRPRGALGVKVWLLERGGYPVFRTAQLANALRHRARGGGR